MHWTEGVEAQMRDELAGKPDAVRWGRTMVRVEFFVAGRPAPGGSKRAWPHPVTGKVIVRDDCKRNREWRTLVWAAARKVYRGPVTECPLRLEATFFLPRPKRSRQEACAPTVRPDLTKLLRSTEDALTGVIWADDAQIVEQRCQKLYAEDGWVGALVTVTELADGDEHGQDAHATTKGGRGNGQGGGRGGNAGVGADAQGELADGPGGAGPGEGQGQG